ncbi:glycosyltransferase family 4 protein [Hymenobacter aerilatus]|uniref:Glycosyltransferase family 4 protein n=1 Tax=Hymenobacter aerilatus TaxID=2932251 RepID=A0A8T9SRQ6_9BACT|nr:glycosyltransferase family 1 protein [Hymenobacter aerilatus]UOR04828.1 glycosyltransferase family 4 protein [Hymenobacter aerilatus]
MKVSYFYRKPIPHFHFSIERIFDAVSSYLQKEVEVERKEMPFFCDRLEYKYKNVLWSRKNNGSINHITGDIHYVALGLASASTVLTIHDVNFMKRRNYLKLVEPYIFSLLIPIAKAKIVTVVSEQTKREVLEYVPFFKNKIRVVPNFYDPAYEIFEKPFNKEKPVLLQIGTSANKNLERLIEAVEDINCTLVIVGRYNKNIEELLLSKQISYEWKQNLTDIEVREQYQQCDIMCFVSTAEGFGMPILEAQAVGRAVITSNTSSMPEVAGNAALLVDPYSVADIRDGILKLIDDDGLRDELIKKGFDNIKRYDIARIGEMYYNLYAEIAAEAK